MAVEHGTSGLVRGLGEARVGLPALCGLVGGEVGRRVRRQAVGAQLAVKVDLDGADVGGADGDVAEEAPAPAAEQHDALVEREEPREGALEVGRHAVELAGKVAAALDDPVGRRVEAVVVAGREVDDGVVERRGLVARQDVVPRPLAESQVRAHLGDGALGRLRGLVLDGAGAVRGAAAAAVVVGLAGEEVGQRVGDAVDAGKLLLLTDGIVGAFMLARLGRAVAAADRRRAGDAGAGRVLAEQGVDGVGHALDLLNVAAVDLPELQDFAVRGREQDLRIGIQRSRTGLECAVEESG